VLSLSIKPKRSKMPLATFEGSIRVGQEKAAMAEEITLTFAYADVTATPVPAPAGAGVAPAPRDESIPPAPLATAINA
jgi:hypothetical protein